MINVYESKSEPLYHGTDYRSAYLIIESNELRANKSNETETYGVSFTRIESSAYDECRISIDQEKLSYNYKIHPVYRDGISGRDLAEERVDKSISNIRKYIIDVDINDKIYLKRLRLELAKLYIDNKELTRENSFEAYDCSILIFTCHKYNIKMGNLLLEAEKYINMFSDGDEDTEYVNKITRRRNKR